MLFPYIKSVGLQQQMQRTREPQSRRALQQQPPSLKTNLQQFLVLVHHVDCTYYGEMNKSSQKEGFGILQTLQFDTYLGFFHNNKAEGVGLLVARDGRHIYGTFLKDEPHGVAITNDGAMLRIGVFTGLTISGIGFEYSYENKLWKMVRYIRGVPITFLKEEQADISLGPPKIMAVQHTLHSLLAAYLRLEYFQKHTENLGLVDARNRSRSPKLIVAERMNPKDTPRDKVKKQKVLSAIVFNKYEDVNSLVVRVKGDIVQLGFSDEVGRRGIGCSFSQSQFMVIEAGYYEADRFSGYCLHSDSSSMRTIGPYHKGQKNGQFIQYLGAQVNVSRYIDDQCTSSLEVGFELVLRKQKMYNYNQKDFMSVRNSLEVDRILSVFLHSEEILQESQGLQNERDYDRKSVSTQKSRGTQQKNFSHTAIKENKLAHFEPGQRSSVKIIREKIKTFKFLEHDESHNASEHLHHRQEPDEDEVALQENPFDSVLQGTIRINESPKKSREKL